VAELLDVVANKHQSRDVGKLAARVTQGSYNTRLRDDFTICFGLGGILGTRRHGKRNKRKDIKKTDCTGVENGRVLLRNTVAYSFEYDHILR
jgi:hypothetical protein